MRRRPRRRRPLRTVLALPLLAALAAGFLYWSNTAVQTTQTEIVFTDLPAGFDGCRVAVLADLHSTEFGEDNETLFAAVE